MNWCANWVVSPPGSIFLARFSTTWPTIGAVSYGYRTETGEVETISDASGCKLSTLYESGVASPYTALAVGHELGDVSSGSTCAVHGAVAFYGAWPARPRAAASVCARDDASAKEQLGVTDEPAATSSGR
jgi:hypothetical protein